MLGDIPTFLEHLPFILDQFDGREFSQPARRTLQNDADASIEHYDADGAEMIPKLAVNVLNEMAEMKPFELDLLHCEQHRENLTVIAPRRFPRLVTSQNPGAQTIQYERKVL